MQDEQSCNHAYLNAFYQQHKSGFDPHFNSRMRRSLSWLKRAEQETDDLHAGYIFYWISFNAGYSPSFEEDLRQSETDKTAEYFRRLAKYDEKQLIYDIIWERYSQEIKGLFDNHYIYAPFWKVANPMVDESWKTGFETSKQKTLIALKNQDSAMLLSLLFSRLYVLRNQLIHGQATWNGPRNRQQVQDGYKIISKLQPVFLSIMLNRPEADWGEVSFELFTGEVEDY